MKKLLIFCLLFWFANESFGQSALIKGLRNGDGVYFGRNHFARAKWKMDTTNSRILLDDSFYLSGSHNSTRTTWILNSSGYSTSTLTSPLTTIYIGNVIYNEVPSNNQPIGAIGLISERLVVSPSGTYQTHLWFAPDSLTWRAFGATTGEMNLHMDTAMIMAYTGTPATIADTTGFPPPTYVWLSRFTGNGQHVNFGTITNATTANTTGTTQGSMNILKLSHTSGTALNTQGITSNVYITGAGNATTIRGFQSNMIHQSTGSINEAEAFYDQGWVNQSNATVADYYGMRLGASNQGTGAITRRWGIFQEDALAKNRFDGKLLVNNVFTATGNPAVIVHDTDSTFKQMVLSLPSSGSYTPALVNTTNISASALNYATYQQIGNIVTVHVSGTLTSSDGTNVVILTIDLPVATSTTFQDAAGSGSVNLWIGSHGTLIGIIPLYALVSNGTHFQIKCFPTTTTISDFAVTIQYHTN